MTTVHDVPPGELVQRAADRLREEDAFTPPDWAPYVKTGSDRERPPEDPDWWYVRVASVLRKVYLRGPVGTSRLRREYGGSRNRGSAPSHGRLGSGSVIRNALQQLEAAGYVETIEGEGRKIAADGQAFLDDVAHETAEALATP